MFNTLMHIIGVCPDSLDHLSLSNLASIPQHEFIHIVNSLKLRLFKIKQFFK